MIIEKGKTVSCEYTLTLEDNEKIDTNVGAEPLTFTHGSNQIIPGLEDKMKGMKTGDCKKITVKPEDGYGLVITEAIIELSTEQVPENSRKVGAMLQTKSPDGQVIRGRITEIDGDKTVIDLNHPLAGKTLFFDVRVVDVK
ncbi:MAG: peptidylprolyl isomerase [Desulfobacteraceae bacterium]|nr:peptidylprolyl isomerase [Desulfobacteraceae bacterium]MBC2756478.1 peptidylprolyl isomerase [Desulfobacteraceae bacterium]